MNDYVGAAEVAKSTVSDDSHGNDSEANPITVHSEFKQVFWLELSVWFRFYVFDPNFDH